MDLNEEKIACLLCGAEACTKYKSHPGYQEGQVYDIHHCSHCGTAFSTPQVVDSEIYNLIYSQIGKMPGYDRYLKYANDILSEKNPLEYLAQAEDIYWAIQNHLKDKSKKDLKILEIGCGFGYLTYAMVKQGYQAKGLDISQKAIDQAKKRYGPHYICADVADYSKSGEKYDLLILTEVIEHIPSVKEFLTCLRDLLRPGGEIILTTPNKSFFPTDLVWETEPPPVHLWWFSENSIRHLAQELGYTSEFVDFKPFNELGDPYPYLNPPFNEAPPFKTIRDFKLSRLPRLDKKGKVIPPKTAIPYQNAPREALKKGLHYLGLLKPIQKLKRQMIKRFSEQNLYKKFSIHKRPTLCAILKKLNIRRPIDC